MDTGTRGPMVGSLREALDTDTRLASAIALQARPEREERTPPDDQL
jgi:hypothetical protein